MIGRWFVGFAVFVGYLCLGAFVFYRIERKEEEIQHSLDIIERLELKGNNNFIESDSSNTTNGTNTGLKNINTGHTKERKLISYMDTMKKNEQDYLNKLLGTAIYATATPFSIVENEHWLKFFKAMRPSYVPPSRFTISNKLLDEKHQQITLHVKKKINDAYVYGVQVDGWSNIRNEPIVNIIITTPEPVVYKSLNTTTNRHTGEYIAQLISDVIDSIGKNRCLGVVTDNAAAMKKAWQILQSDNRYENLPIAYYSCFCHTLNLLIHDIVKLESFSTVEENAKKVVKTINNVHILKSTLVKIQKSKNQVLGTLKMPVQTRWGSIVSCLKSIEQNKGCLQQLSWSENEHVIGKLGNIKMILLDFVFWNKIESMLILLKPIADWILKLESNHSFVSDVVYALNDINSLLTNNLPNIDFISDKEKESVLKSFEQRKNMALHPMHYAGSILDPRTQGTNLTTAEDIAGVEYIYNVTKSLMKEECGNIMTELAQYRSHEGLWGKEFVWSVELEQLNPFTWWRGICGSSSISKIATAILSLPCSSAATERSFSTFSLIHTKKRNRLSNSRAEKLLFVHQNMNNLKIQTKEKPLCTRRLRNDGAMTQINCAETPETTEEPTLFSPTEQEPSTSNFMLNTSETTGEMHDPSSSSDEEEWDTDNLVNDSIDSESFSSHSEWDEFE